MLSDEWLSRYGLLENFNASVTRTGTGTGTGTGTHTGTGTWTTGVTAIALCTSCSRAKNRSCRVTNTCKTVYFVNASPQAGSHNLNSTKNTLKKPLFPERKCQFFIFVWLRTGVFG